MSKVIPLPSPLTSSEFSDYMKKTSLPYTLEKKGIFISKLFMGSSFNEIVALAKKYFKEVRVFKPLASRKNSKETFIVCKFLR